MMAKSKLSEDQIMAYLEQLENEEMSEDDIVDLGDDVTITWEEVRSEDEVDQDDTGGPSYYPTTRPHVTPPPFTPVTPPPTTSHVDAVVMPSTSHSAIAETTTPVTPTGASRAEAETTSTSRDSQEFDSQDLDELAEELVPEYSLIYKLPKQTVVAGNRHVWSTKPPRPKKRKRDSANYTPGPTPATDGVIEADEIFSLFLDDLTVSRIVYFTNEFIDKVKQKFKNLRNMYDHTSTMEMKALLGVLIMSGVRRDNRISSEEMFSSDAGAGLYRAGMSERRFSYLLRCLRFDDAITRNERKKTDRLAAIRDVWDTFLSNCKNCYIPGADITIDEQLLSFRGRVVFKMYMKNKPAKYGLKNVLACDARSHYMFNAYPYLGKGSVPKTEGSTQGQFLTEKLIEGYTGAGRTITTDNWFTSLPLAMNLLQEDTHLVGTMRPKPYVPREAITSKADRLIGSSLFLHDNNVTLLSYKAKKDKNVLLLSTRHHTQTISGRKNKPEILHYYNKHKGGVDVFDQLCAKYSCSRKTRRWPVCFFMGMVNMTTVNAYVIHKEQMQKANRNPKETRVFLREMAKGLVKPWAFRRLHQNGQHASVREVIQDVYQLQRTATPSPEPPRPAAIKRCSLCMRNKDRKTKTTCYKCSKPVCHEHSSHVCNYCRD
ncbi:hypothetical protein Pcinc_001374 [Petrolisthes cinctipes]|uniref:PiggyBac transposable element-derived protein domain-containing protein n=1 Tax=Petrolisthes cinctipes TaxID=88211 RepID=A0AAE1L3Y5_PETCI|nr:hypothetical protein Pcinc_001374 [Petrolisthes cinctipes]